MVLLKTGVSRRGGQRATLAEALAGHGNALNFVRLVLASAVILAHTWPLGGFGTSPWENISDVAVNGFFAISGFLIAGSRMRSGMAPFLWRRALRIFPAFWVCLAAVALVFSPVAARLADDHWSASSALRYVVTNAFLWIQQRGIAETLTGVPYPEAWNGSLWTLMYEFGAYVAAGFILSGPLARPRKVPVLLASLVGVLALELLARGPLAITTNLYLNGLRLAGFFLAGMVLWAVADRLPATPLLGVPSVLAIPALVLVGDVAYWIFGAIPTAYAVLWLGAVLPTRVGSVNDISYGLYIYAFPVQQLLAVLHVPERLGFWGFALTAWLLTLPLATASWFLVEKPALRLRRLIA